MDKPMDTMRVVLLEPEKEAQITEIGASLEDMQAAVGGYIEAVYPFQEHVALVCNDEGKLLGLPLNRALRYEDTKEIYDITVPIGYATGWTNTILPAPMGRASQTQPFRELFKISHIRE